MGIFGPEYENEMKRKFEAEMRKKQIDFALSELDYLFKQIKNLAKEDNLTRDDAEEALKFFHSRLESLMKEDEE